MLFGAGWWSCHLCLHSTPRENIDASFSQDTGNRTALPSESGGRNLPMSVACCIVSAKEAKINPPLCGSTKECTLCNQLTFTAFKLQNKLLAQSLHFAFSLFPTTEVRMISWLVQFTLCLINGSLSLLMLIKMSVGTHLDWLFQSEDDGGLDVGIFKKC